MNSPDTLSISRRDLLVVGAASGAAVARPIQAANGTLPAAVVAEKVAALAAQPPASTALPRSKVTLQVNGQAHTLELDNRTSLLDTLREHLHLTGTKKGCDHGQCGACTVMLDGRRINACLTLAVMHQGANITTIEGLGTPQRLHPMQAAFVKHDSYQCGYCTPGQICAAVAVLDEIKAGIPSHVSADLTARPVLSKDELRERMSGNICRCGAYANIIDAMSDVAGVGA